MTPRSRVTPWLLAGSLLATSLLVAFFAVETAHARRQRLLAEGRRVALSAVTLYDVLRLTGAEADRATLVSFVQAAVHGSEDEDELVFIDVRDAEGRVVAAQGPADTSAPGVVRVHAQVVARDRGDSGTDTPAGRVTVGLSTATSARELLASVGLGGGAALLGAVGLALALSSLVRRRVLSPMEGALEAEREEQERLAGALTRAVGQQRARAVVENEAARVGRVTVMVVHVADFLPMLQRQPPEAALRLLDELYAVTARVVHTHGGHVEKMLGETVQCVWGIRGARPDDELRAVAAALQVQREVAALAAARKQRGDEPFAVGVGLATGEAVIGTVGGAARAEAVVVGEVTAVAQAVEEEARAHGFGLLVDEETFRCVSSSYEGAATPPMLVRGIGVPLTLYRVRPRRPSARVDGETTDPVRRAARPSAP